jgi:mevalonate kinase
MQNYAPKFFRILALMLFCINANAFSTKNSLKQRNSLLQKQSTKAFEIYKELNDGRIKLDQVLHLSKVMKLSSSIFAKQELEGLKLEVYRHLLALRARIYAPALNKSANLQVNYYRDLAMVMKRVEKTLVHIRDVDRRFNNNERVVEARVNAIKDQFSLYIEDVLNCKKVGTVNDRRELSKQYYCNELGFGDTSVIGATYARYLLDYKKYNYIRNNRVLNERKVPLKKKKKKKKKKKVLSQQERCTYLRTMAFYVPPGLSRCVDHKLSLREFKIAFSKEIIGWKTRKRVTTIPLEYKDKRKVRRYSLAVNASRQQKSTFKVFEDKIKFDGDVAYAKACFQIPGTEILQTKAKLKYTWHKKITEKVILKLPGMKFDELTTCVLYKISPKMENSIQLIGMLTPQLRGVELTPFKIKFSGGLLGSITSIVKKLSLGFININSMISAFTNVALSLSVERDIKSGKIFLDLVKNTLEKQLAGKKSFVTNSKYRFNKEQRVLFSGLSGEKDGFFDEDKYHQYLDQKISKYKEIVQNSIENSKQFMKNEKAEIRNSLDESRQLVLELEKAIRLRHLELRKSGKDLKGDFKLRSLALRLELIVRLEFLLGEVHSGRDIASLKQSYFWKSEEMSLRASSFKKRLKAFLNQIK